MSQSGGCDSGNMKKMRAQRAESCLSRGKESRERGETGAEGTGCWTSALDTIAALLGRNCDFQSHLESPSPKDLMIGGFLFLFMSGNIVYAISTCFTSLDVCWMVQASKNSSTNHHPRDPGGWHVTRHHTLRLWASTEEELIISCISFLL